MPAAPSIAPPSTATPALSDHHLRLMNALADALGERGYADVTIADIVARARVSKRTFYECFESKQACFLALCRYVSDSLMALIQSCAQPARAWSDVVSDVTRTYLSTIHARPALMRALYTEIYAAGQPGRAVRRDIGLRFADFLRAQVDEARKTQAGLKPLSAPLATAVVAGVNEMILELLEEDRAEALPSLAAPAQELVLALTRA